MDSRSLTEGAVIRRRRQCTRCRRRFTTYERIEEIAIKITKKDGRKEDYDREKLFAGIQRACEKRPVSNEQMEKLILDIEKRIGSQRRKEVTSKRLGEMVMKKLQKIDEVAYVRFASVYRQFKDIGQFMQEVKGLLNK